MADDIDRANERVEIATAAAIAANAKEIPHGEEGDCEYCGKHFARLIGGACGHCRDEYRLP